MRNAREEKCRKEVLELGEIWTSIDPKRFYAHGYFFGITKYIGSAKQEFRIGVAHFDPECNASTNKETWDTHCATPCLALLRTVFKKVEVAHAIIGGVECWGVRPLDITDVDHPLSILDGMSTSKTRIQATILAFKAYKAYNMVG